MRKALVASCLGLAALVATLAPAAADKRVALIIGNSTYQHAPTLANPGNDAGDMAAKLRTLGFEVVDGIDLRKRDMEKRIRAFADLLAGADVGLFYYAGHGLQVDGRNFLAPIDAELRSESDLDFEAVELDLVLKQMVRNAPTSIVFLDACRDNPLAAKLATVSRSIDIGRGLARVETPASMMVVYATEPGKVALDGSGRNSPFTAALLRHIATEGASISDVMIDVRNDVLKETGGQQRPFESASLTGKFYFKPRAETAAASTADEFAALRAEIARLQANQNKLLKSQEEQLERLQAKLADEAGTEPPPGPAAPAAPSPSASSVTPQATTASTPAAETKTAAVESKTPSAESAAAPAQNAAPLPDTPTRDQIAADMQNELKRLGCYFGKVGNGWGPKSRLAVEGFNRISELDLPPEEPEAASLQALKGWNGPNCEVAAVTPKAAPAPAVAPKKQAAPKKSSPSKASRPAPAPRAQAAKPRPRPSTSDSGSAEINELQRMFPEAAWPKKR